MCYSLLLKTESLACDSELNVCASKSTWSRRRYVVRSNKNYKLRLDANFCEKVPLHRPAFQPSTLNLHIIFPVTRTTISLTFQRRTKQTK